MAVTESAYDGLADKDQTIVRDAWDERIASRIASLDLVTRFRAADLDYAEADDDGNLIVRAPKRATSS